MVRDPLAPKRLAAAIAFGGLSYMMIVSAPHWGSIGVGLFSLVAFGVLWLVPEMRRRAVARAPIATNAFRPERRRELILLGSEPPQQRLYAQPLMLKRLRVRRGREG